MNKNSISQTFDDDYPEISQSDLNRAVKRRNFATVSAKQNVNLTLDADIITWLQQKAGVLITNPLSTQHLEKQ